MSHGQRLTQILHFNLLLKLVDLFTGFVNLEVLMRWTSRNFHQVLSLCQRATDLANYFAILRIVLVVQRDPTLPNADHIQNVTTVFVGAYFDYD